MKPQGQWTAEESAQEADRQRLIERSATPKPRAGEHTKGPWRLHTNFADTVSAGPLGEKSAIARCEPNGQAQENAQRIVACVNACEGISNETLAADHFLRSLDEAIRERDALKAQLQDLLNVADSLIFRPSVDDSKQIDRDTLALRAILEPARALLAKHGR